MKIVNSLPPETKTGEMVCMDVETFGQEQGKLHRPTGTFACVSICQEGDPSTVYQIYDPHQVRKLLAATKRGTWVFHNSLYDLRQMQRHDPTISKEKFVWDTMLLEQSMSGGYYQYFSLKDLTRRWLNEVMDKEARADFETATEMSPEMKRYAARDAEKTLQISMRQREVYSTELPFQAYKRIDEPCIWPVLDMEGIRVDVGAWEKVVKGFEVKAHALEDELGINVNSKAQVIRFAAKLGIHITDTQADTLAEFSSNKGIAKVMEARMYRKAVSTYGMKWLAKSVEADGKVYASYHVNGTETYRFSASNPGMQQIPQRKLPIYRTLFIPSLGNVMSVWDIKQQEPCILAFVTKDETLLRAITGGEDLHLAVARAIFNDPKMKKEDSRRFLGKTINLGTSYGLTAIGLARKAHLEIEEAEKFLRMYFQRFPDVFLWIGRQRSYANQFGYITSPAGHRVYVNPYDNQHDNNAINAPIQTGAAEMTKVWMRKYWELCREESLTYAICAQVHDEIVRDVPKGEFKENDALNDLAFHTAAEMLYKGVPFSYDAEHGKSWACKSLAEEREDEED